MNVVYAEQGDLALFDGLKFRRDKRTGYYLNAKTHMRLHRYVWQFFNGAIPEGFHVHHKDEDKRNNDIENLACIPAKSHLAFHRNELVANRYDEIIENLNVRARPKASEWHRSEAGIAWHKDHAKKIGFGEKQTGLFICQQCGKSYTAAVTGNNRFCSNACTSAHRRAAGLDNETRVCVICGTEFVTNRYSKATTCSRHCRGKLRWKNKKAQRGD